jgi:ribose 5-phosphate isomerase
MTLIDCRKTAAAEAAVALVESGEVVGLEREARRVGIGKRRLRGLGAYPTLRTTAQGRAVVTQDGHYILDCAFDALDDPDDLGVQLDGTIGVVEHGRFLGMAARVVVGTSRGVNVLGDGP